MHSYSTNQHGYIQWQVLMKAMVFRELFAIVIKKIVAMTVTSTKRDVLLQPGSPEGSASVGDEC